MSATFASVSVSELPAGTVLTSPIFDPANSGVKLLGSSLKISESFIEQLSARGIDSVVVSNRDLAVIRAGKPQGSLRSVSDHEYPTAPLVTESSREIDSEIKTTIVPADVAPEEGTKVERLGDPPMDRYDEDAKRHEIIQRERQVSNVQSLIDHLLQTSRADSDAVLDISRQSIQSIINDKDLFLCLAGTPFDTDYPARHSLHTCALATSIGVMLGFDDNSLTNLGAGCLIHDVGMLKLYRPLHRIKRRLNTREISRLVEHPILTFDALANAGLLLTPISRIVAYQIHERGDGSGYPRGWTEDRIHPLAKIAAVADVYVGLVSNRPHRQGMMPYFAVKKILDGIKQRLYEPKVVRGLLHAISLFPIGSFVSTSDGRTCRVVRSTGESYMQPIIERWDEKHQQFEPDLINLVEETSIRIVKAAADPRTAQ